MSRIIKYYIYQLKSHKEVFYSVAIAFFDLDNFVYTRQKAMDLFYFYDIK